MKMDPDDFLEWVLTIGFALLVSAAVVYVLVAATKGAAQ